MTDFSAPPERVFAGTVGKGHGLDGSFYVVSAVPSLLAKGAELWVGAEAEPRTVERRAGTDEKPIIASAGRSPATTPIRSAGSRSRRPTPEPAISARASTGPIRSSAAPCRLGMGARSARSSS